MGTGQGNLASLTAFPCDPHRRTAMHPIFYLWVFLLVAPMVFGLVDLANTGRSRRHDLR